MTRSMEPSSGGGFSPPRRLARESTNDSMDEPPSPRPPLIDDASYQGPPAGGFEDSKGAGAALFSAASLDPRAPSDFGFLMGGAAPGLGALAAGKEVGSSAAPSMASDDQDLGVASADRLLKRQRSCDDDGEMAIAAPCPAIRPHQVAFGVVDGEDRGDNPMDPPIHHVDPYFWIRDQTHEDVEVQKLLKDEDTYCRQTLAHLQKLRERLYSEMIGHTKEADVDVPAPDADGFAYYCRSFAGKPYKAHYRAKILGDAGCGSGANPAPADIRSLGPLVGVELGEEELIFDENTLIVDADGNERPYVSVRGPNLSHDNLLMAVGEDFEGNDCYAIKFRSYGSKDQGSIPDQLERTDGSILWDASGHAGIYYIGLDTEFRTCTALRHVLGTPQNQDSVLLDEKDQRYSVYMSKTHDDRILVVSSCSAETCEHYVLDLHAPATGLVCVSKRQFGHMYQVDHCNGFLYLQTNKDGAINHKLCRTPVATLAQSSGPGSWQDVWVPGNRVKIESIRCFEKFLAIEGREEGIRRIFILHCDGIGADGGPAVQSVVFPEAQPHDGTLLTPRRRLAAISLYSTGFHTMRMFNSQILRLYRADYCCPSRIYSYHVATKEFKLLKEEPAPGFDPSRYRAERITSQHRGVPISLVYRADLHSEGLQGGPYPTLLQGYGSYGMSLDPDFDKTILSLLDRGVVFATAHVRGGGELGREWTEDGRQFKVKNRFLDFEAAAETLLSLGISQKSRLVAWGESSGGLTVGATANTRPDLFKALLMEVPYVDCLNTMCDPKIPLTCGDWSETGNSNEVDYFHYIMEYSPYENIRMQSYPTILCTASLNDAMVGFWEPLKYLAKLRRTKLDDNPVMAKVNFHAGHMHSSDRYDVLRERAFLFAFVLDQMGITT